jgi:hypothetical protein
LVAGDHIYLQSKANAASFHRYTITSAATLIGGTTWQFGVTTDSGSPSGTEPANGADVLLAFQFQPLQGPTGPAGPTGSAGPAGATGPTGPPGVGIPTGGTTNQVLAKTSLTDYATGWADAAPIRRTVKADTSTAYAPLLTDENQTVTLSNASAITVTLPQDSTTAFPTGAEIEFVQIGAGQVTFAAGSGATVNGTPGLKLRAQWSAASAKKRAANTWVVIGDLSA